MKQPIFRLEKFYPDHYEIGESQFGSQSFYKGFKELNLNNMKIIYGISHFDKNIYLTVEFNHIPLGAEFSGSVAEKIINKITGKSLESDILEEFIIEKIVDASGSEFIIILKDIFEDKKYQYLLKKKKEFSSWINGKNLDSVKLESPQYDKEMFHGDISILFGYMGGYQDLKDDDIVYQSSVDGNDLYLTYSLYLNEDLKIVVDYKETKEEKHIGEDYDVLHNLAESRMLCKDQLVINLLKLIMRSPSEFMNIISKVAYEHAQEQFKKELSYFSK